MSLSTELKEKVLVSASGVGRDQDATKSETLEDVQHWFVSPTKDLWRLSCVRF